MSLLLPLFSLPKFSLLIRRRGKKFRRFLSIKKATDSLLYFGVSVLKPPRSFSPSSQPRRDQEQGSGAGPESWTPFASVVSQRRSYGHCLCDSVLHSSWDSNCVVRWYGHSFNILLFGRRSTTALVFRVGACLESSLFFPPFPSFRWCLMSSDVG